jgi:hypothetical protein
MNEEQRANLKRHFDEVHARIDALAKLHHEQVHPAIAAAFGAIEHPTVLDDTVLKMHLRALGWGLSLRQLVEPFYFQAHSAGCRSLFEIVIDLVLLTKGVEPAEKMLGWERVAIYRSAEFQARAGDPVAPQHLAPNAATIRTTLAQFWPDLNRKPGKRLQYPDRWTNATLFADAKRADDAAPNLRLALLARANYDRLCWGTHGSGLVLLRAIDPHLFPGLATLALFTAGNLLSDAMRLALEYFKLFDEGWSRALQAVNVAARLAVHKRSVDAIANLPDLPGDEE